MSVTLNIVGRITRQGPRAPLAGDALSLPVYEYEIVEPAGSLRRGELICVGHRSADVDSPEFAVGRLRRLRLTDEFPPHGTLLFADGQPRHGHKVWFCPESAPMANGNRSGSAAPDDPSA